MATVQLSIRWDGPRSSCLSAQGLLDLAFELVFEASAPLPLRLRKMKKMDRFQVSVNGQFCLEFDGHQTMVDLGSRLTLDAPNTLIPYCAAYENFPRLEEHRGMIRDVDCAGLGLFCLERSDRVTLN